MATEAYCVKCKAKREMKRRDQDHHEERQARDPGHLPGVWHEDVQDRRLTPDLKRPDARDTGAPRAVRPPARWRGDRATRPMRPAAAA